LGLLFYYIFHNIILSIFTVVSYCVIRTSLPTTTFVACVLNYIKVQTINYQTLKFCVDFFFFCCHSLYFYGKIFSHKIFHASSWESVHFIINIIIFDKTHKMWKTSWIIWCKSKNFILERKLFRKKTMQAWTK
jgi:hypothetical protein